MTITDETIDYVGILAKLELSDEEKEQVLAGFRSVKGLIKREIGHQIKLRHIPELIFKIDKSMEYGRHIDDIISSLDIKHDEEE